MDRSATSGLAQPKLLACAPASNIYLIDQFVRDGRLANLLKILVVLICLAAILQRVLPLFGVGQLL